MGILILTMIGAVLGWLVTILLRVEEARDILRHSAAGVVGALLAGLFLGNASIVGGISSMALLWAVLGATVAIAGFTLISRRALR